VTVSLEMGKFAEAEFFPSNERFPCRYIRSLINGRARRHDAAYPRAEPGAGKPHARILRAKAGWTSYSTMIVVPGRARCGKAAHLDLWGRELNSRAIRPLTPRRDLTAGSR
jgi:hypothetical protein